MLDQVSAIPDAIDVYIGRLSVAEHFDCLAQVPKIDKCLLHSVWHSQCPRKVVESSRSINVEFRYRLKRFHIVVIVIRRAICCDESVHRV